MTGFVNQQKFAIVDFYVHSVNESSFDVIMSDNGLSLSLKTAVPTSFTGSERLRDEYILQGDRDVIIGAHDETSDWIIQNFGNPPIQSNPGQQVLLPFACVHTSESQLIWNPGCPILAGRFAQDPDPPPRQLMPILRIALRNLQKSRAANGFTPSRVTQGARAWATPPPMPGGGGPGGGGGRVRGRSHTPASPLVFLQVPCSA